jgi:hypothetical protein
MALTFNWKINEHLPLPLAGEGWGEGGSLSIAASTFPLILAFSPGRRDFQPYLA